MSSNSQASTMDQAADAGTSSTGPIEVSAGVARLQANAAIACELLKCMAHESRLIILSLLSLQERSVMELEESLDLRQPAVSQQLARLRSDKLVKTRRHGKMIYYSLASEEARTLVGALISHYGTS